MSPKTEEVFKLWLSLNEDEKRDFVKELFYFNNLTSQEKSEIERKYLK